MACLKCGKKTKDTQVFCPACLGVMEAYPVKSDLHIQLPNRKERTLPKRNSRKRRTLTRDEQLAILKKRQSWLIAALVLLALLLGTAAGLLFYSLAAPDASEWGKHYATQLPTE